MGVMSYTPAQPFEPLPATPGVPPSGIGQSNDIRGMANAAKQQTAARQQRFLSMMELNAGGTQPVAKPPMTRTAALSDSYVKAGEFLRSNQTEIARFVDWVLYG